MSSSVKHELHHIVLVFIVLISILFGAGITHAYKANFTFCTWFLRITSIKINCGEAPGFLSCSSYSLQLTVIIGLIVKIAVQSDQYVNVIFHSQDSNFICESCDLQDNYEFLSRCIKEDLGFKDGKPLAACIIYKCLLHWHAFESERTAIFNFIIEGINDVLKVALSSIFFFLF